MLDNQQNMWDNLQIAEPEKTDAYDPFYYCLIGDHFSGGLTKHLYLAPNYELITHNCCNFVNISGKGKIEKLAWISSLTIMCK